MKTCMLSVVLASGLWAQTIDGDVVDALAGTPVAGADIRRAGDTRISSTDAAGHFTIPASGVGTLLQIAHPGYLPLTYHPPAGANNLRVRLMPQGVIEGKIYDEDGFPVGNADMEALRYRVVSGRRILQAAGSVRSDDRGLFRISGLCSGRYYLRATPYGNTVLWDSRYLPRYYPDSLQPRDNDRIEVKAGEERTVDFRLGKFEGVTVKGRVAGTGSVIPGMQVFLQAEGDLPFTQERPLLFNSGFVFRHVPPGTYQIRASGRVDRYSAGRRLAEQRIQVGNSDVSDVVFALHPAEPIELAGSIAFEGGAVAQPVQITVRPAAGAAFTARCEADGPFVFKGLMPDHYDLEIRPVAEPGRPSPGRFGIPVSARIGSAEILRSGFDLDGRQPEPLRITMSAAQGSLAMTVHGTAGAPLVGAQVLLVSGPGMEQTSRGTTAVNGLVRLTGMAGEARLFIVPDDCDTDVFFDPEWLAAHHDDFPPIQITAGPHEGLTVTYSRAR